MFVQDPQFQIRARAEAAKQAKSEAISVDSVVARGLHALLPVAPRDTEPSAQTFAEVCWPRKMCVLQPLEAVRLTYDLCAYLAFRSIAAYEIGKGAKQLDDLKRLAADGESGTDFGVFDNGFDAAVGYRCGRTLIVAFRGAATLKHWTHINLRFGSSGNPLRHVGFHDAWGRLAGLMKPWIEATLPKEGELMLTGHSMGGALAILAAFDLVKQYPVRAVVTLGAPRLGSEEFRDAYARQSTHIGSPEQSPTLGQVTRRIIHANDVVSRVPPGPWCLSHAGKLEVGESAMITDRLLGGADRVIG